MKAFKVFNLSDFGEINNEYPSNHVGTNQFFSFRNENRNRKGQLYTNFLHVFFNGQPVSVVTVDGLEAEAESLRNVIVEKSEDELTLLAFLFDDSGYFEIDDSRVLLHVTRRRYHSLDYHKIKLANLTDTEDSVEVLATNNLDNDDIYESLTFLEKGKTYCIERYGYFRGGVIFPEEIFYCNPEKRTLSSSFFMYDGERLCAVVN